MRWLIIGLGNMGQKHKAAINRVWRDAEIGFLETDDYRQPPMASGLVRVPGDQIGAFDPNYIVISVPSHLHLDTLVSLGRCDARILVEKPCGASLDQVNSIRDLAQRNDLDLSIGFVERFKDEAILLRRAIANGSLGKVFSIETNRSSRNLFEHDRQMATDLISHDIDLVRFIFQAEYGEPLGKEHSAPSGKEIVLGGAVADGGIKVIHRAATDDTLRREMCVRTEAGVVLVDFAARKVQFPDERIKNFPRGEGADLMRIDFPEKPSDALESELREFAKNRAGIGARIHDAIAAHRALSALKD